MTTAKKIQANRLTAKRTRKAIKRKPHIQALKLKEYKVSIKSKRIAKAAAYRRRRFVAEQPMENTPLL